MTLIENRLDTTWITDDQLRIECQERFLAKYGFYYIDGTIVKAPANKLER